MRRLVHRINLVLTVGLAFSPTVAHAYGMLVPNPGLVATARSKIRARPDFFSVIYFVTINQKNEASLLGSFDFLSESCGRGAEIHQRIEKKIGPKEKPTEANAAKVMGAFNAKLNGLCVNALEFFLSPWPQLAPGVAAEWARVLRKHMGDYKLYLDLPGLENGPGHFTFDEGTKVLEQADGVALYLHAAPVKEAAEFRDLVVKNMEWANTQATKLGKKVILYLPSFQDLNWNGIPAFRNFSEGLKAIQSLKKEQVKGLCTDAVRLGVVVVRVDDPKLDREILQFEKWREGVCGPPPDKP